jgi:hypothetical protein
MSRKAEDSKKQETEYRSQKSEYKAETASTDILFFCLLTSDF